MAAQVLLCVVCSCEFTARAGAKTCSDRCRTAKRRSRPAAALPPDYEPLVVAEIYAGRLTSEEGLLWTLFPDRMRARASVQVAA
jgi:hypothetical protein